MSTTTDAPLDEPQHARGDAPMWAKVPRPVRVVAFLVALFFVAAGASYVVTSALGSGEYAERTVTGTVVVAGESVDDAELTFFEDDGAAVVTGLLTDSEGTFEFTGELPGSLRIVAEGGSAGGVEVPATVQLETRIDFDGEDERRVQLRGELPGN